MKYVVRFSCFNGDQSSGNCTSISCTKHSKNLTHCNILTQGPNDPLHQKQKLNIVSGCEINNLPISTSEASPYIDGIGDGRSNLQSMWLCNQHQDMTISQQVWKLLSFHQSFRFRQINSSIFPKAMVKFPFRENPHALGESKDIAFIRLLGLERRLLNDPAIRAQYIKFIKEYEQRVFDELSKTSFRWLNYFMYIDPTLQSELFSILVRFRLSKYIFTTGIEKIYRQILINADDRKYQMILCITIA